MRQAAGARACSVGVSADSERGDAVVQRAVIGAKLLTARGAAMRAVSAASNIGLIFLVTPADLGLLAVVRGVAGLAGDASDLGFAWALLRRHEIPTDAEYRALGGVQLSIVLVFLGVTLMAPSLAGSISATPPEWRHWMVAVLVTMLTVPFGTGARIRIERQMDYGRIARADVSSVLLLNVILLGFAAANRFTIGVFVATGGATLYNNLLLWFWSPGPFPGFELRAWRRLGREFAGFSLGHVGSLLNASATPLLIAKLFGLPVAGIWSFASRLGNLLSLAFEGFRRAAIPAAAMLARSTEGLRRLAQHSLLGSARLTLPLLTAAYIAVPIIGWLLPKWAPAVPLAQVYLLGLGLAGVIGASLVPSAVALAGPRVVIAEQFAPIAIAWTGFAILAALGRSSVIWVVLPMHIATAVAVWCSTASAVRPPWSPELRRPLLALAAVCALGVAGHLVNARPLLVAVLSAGVLLAIGLPPQATGWFGALAMRRQAGQP